MSKKPQKKIEFIPIDRHPAFPSTIPESEWHTPEEVTASAILTDNNEVAVTQRHIRELEKALNTEEASEVLVRNVRALLAKWRLGAS